MNDMIYRQEAIDAIENIEWYHLNTKGEMESGANSAEHQAWYKADDIYKVLEELPSAQPEQKVGKWIIATGMMPPEFHGHHCCSECGNFANMEPPFGNQEDLSKFCPNCGVKMEGEIE